MIKNVEGIEGLDIFVFHYVWQNSWIIDWGSQVLSDWISESWWVGLGIAKKWPRLYLGWGFVRLWKRVLSLHFTSKECFMKIAKVAKLLFASWVSRTGSCDLAFAGLSDLIQWHTWLMDPLCLPDKILLIIFNIHQCLFLV